MEAGGVICSIDLNGYAYPDGAGPDSNWVRGLLIVTAGGVRVERPFLTLVSAMPAWVTSLTQFTYSPGEGVVLSNTEDDFEIELRHVGGDLQGEVRTQLSDGLVGSFRMAFPLTLDAVDMLRVGLEEATWVYPERAS